MATAKPNPFAKSGGKKDNENKMEKDSTDDAQDRKNVQKVLTAAGVTDPKKRAAGLALWDKLDD